MAAYTNRDAWGGLADKVARAIGQVGRAYDEGSRLQGEGAIRLSHADGEGSGWSNPVLDAAGKTWNLPNTAVGMALGAGAYAVGKIVGSDPHLRWGDNAAQWTNSPFDFGGRALTLGNAQIYPKSAGPHAHFTSAYTGAQIRNGDHERAHSYQGQLLGPLFGPLEIAGAALMGDHNPLETAADRYATGKLRNGF